MARTMQGKRSAPVTQGLENEVFIAGRSWALPYVFCRGTRRRFFRRVLEERTEKLRWSPGTEPGCKALDGRATVGLLTW